MKELSSKLDQVSKHARSGTVQYAVLDRTEGRGRIRQIIGETHAENSLVIARPDSDSEREAERVANALTGGVASEVGSAVSTPARVPTSVHEVLRRPGQPLPDSTRAEMEPLFSQDFGAVRIHTGALAAQSARQLNARAYTVGTHIVAAVSHQSLVENRGLLAHELHHVVQSQRTGPQVLHRQTDASHGESLNAEVPQPAGGTAIYVIDTQDNGYLQKMDRHFRIWFANVPAKHVNSIESMVNDLTAKSGGNTKTLGRIIVIAHGGVASEQSGRIALAHQYAEQIEYLGNQNNNREKLRKLMMPSTVVEIWGCYVGGDERLGKALANLLSAQVVATPGELDAHNNLYWINETEREIGEALIPLFPIDELQTNVMVLTSNRGVNGEVCYRRGPSYNEMEHDASLNYLLEHNILRQANFPTMEPCFFFPRDRDHYRTGSHIKNSRGFRTDLNFRRYIQSQFSIINHGINSSNMPMTEEDYNHIFRLFDDNNGNLGSVRIARTNPDHEGGNEPVSPSDPTWSEQWHIFQPDSPLKSENLSTNRPFSRLWPAWQSWSEVEMNR